MYAINCTRCCYASSDATIIVTFSFQEIKQRCRYGKNRADFAAPPTFTEFVRFIINEDLNDRTMDMHWEPVYKFCTPCLLPITHIVKMETFNQDQV